MKKKMNKLVRVVTEEMLRQQGMIGAGAPPGMDDNYIFNFRNQFVGNGGFTPINSTAIANFNIEPMVASTMTIGTMQALPAGAKAPVKQAVKPVDVVKELYKEPNAFSLAGLDDKITLLKEKADLTNQRQTKDEILGYMERLQNRKRYAEFAPFFRSFNDTTEEAVEALLVKYQSLDMFPHDLFVPELPAEAIQIMKKYTEIAKTITGKKPVFYIIAPKEEFKKRTDKRDPILLAQSLFGFYYQVLGAWDKEMVLLNEL